MPLPMPYRRFRWPTILLFSEEEFEAGREKEQTLPVDRKKSTTPKKGLKNLVKSCVTRKKREDND
ncbi:hypothetical protein OROMI_017879 [Orobanche minor]